MNVKWNSLFYSMCVLMNIGHIYHICDQYFRYDVTTNVKIGLPDIVEFPSLTMCLDLAESLKWEEMSSELIRKLLFKLPYQTFNNESFVEELIRNPSWINREIRAHPYVTKGHIYNRLAKEKNASEIFKLTASFEHLFRFFGTTGLAHNSYGSQNLKRMQYRLPTDKDFQFTVDTTFIHGKRKCFTINIRPELKKIKFPELFTLIPDSWVVTWVDRSNLLSWFSSFGSQIKMYVLGKGHLDIGVHLIAIDVNARSEMRTFFESHESIRLEHPYKTNCRDYTTIGLLSRKHCLSMCFQSKSIERFKSIIEESHAFPSDNIALASASVGTALLHNQISRFFGEQCAKICPQKDCRYVTHFSRNFPNSEQMVNLQTKCSEVTGSARNCSIYDSNQLRQNHSSFMLRVKDDRLWTRTQSQAAYPLVSFLTEAFSTFGFWLGFSVSGTFFFFRQTWMEAKNLRNKMKARQRLAPNLRLTQPQFAFIRQVITMLKQREYSDFRREC